MGPAHSFVVGVMLSVLQRGCVAVQQGNFLATQGKERETGKAYRVEDEGSGLSPLTAQVPAVLQGDLPHNGKVAVVLRGEAFRGEELCDTGSFSWDNQVSATRSLVSQVLDPLENELKNAVDVVFSESSGCERNQKLQTLIEIIGKDRVMGFQHFYAASQAQSMDGALSAFENASEAKQRAIESYDLVLIVRQDSFYNLAFPQWPGNFSQLNSPCYCTEEMQQDPYFGKLCVDDRMHAFPGHLYKPFRDVVKAKDNRCFNDALDPAGHLCFPSFQEAVRPTGSGADVLDGGDPGMIVETYALSPTKVRADVKKHLLAMRPATFGNSPHLPAPLPQLRSLLFRYK